MPILSLFPKLAFNPEEVKLIVAAYEQACTLMQLDACDPRRELLARKILEIAARGLEDPQQMCTRALSEFREQHQPAA